MNPAASGRAGPSVCDVIRRWTAWHPEWWSLAISFGAWLFLLAPRWLYGGGEPACAACQAQLGWTAGLFGWLVMVQAMMLPLMIFPLRATAFGSLWCRRHQAMATLLTGYLAVWLVAGIFYLLLETILLKLDAIDRRRVIATAFFVAAGWQLTGMKRRCSVACHLIRPLAPVGWQAHRDCLCFGAELGFACIGNCGLLMLAGMLSPWHQITMVATTILLLYERYWVRPNYRGIVLAICFMGIFNLILD